MLKPDIEFNTQKTIEAEKKNDKDGKIVVQINEHCYLWKTKENLKCSSKPSYMSHKIFSDNLVAKLH